MPTRDYTGKAFTGSKTAEIKHSIRKKAVRMWNEKDKSEIPRMSEDI